MKIDSIIRDRLEEEIPKKTAKSVTKPFFRVAAKESDEKEPPIKQMIDLVPEVSQLSLQVTSTSSKPAPAPKGKKAMAAAQAATAQATVDIFDVDATFAPHKTSQQVAPTPAVQQTFQDDDDDDDENWGFTSAKPNEPVSVGTTDATVSAFISSGAQPQQPPSSKPSLASLYAASANQSFLQPSSSFAPQLDIFGNYCVFHVLLHYFLKRHVKSSYVCRAPNFSAEPGNVFTSLLLEFVVGGSISFE